MLAKVTNRPYYRQLEVPVTRGELAEFISDDTDLPITTVESVLGSFMKIVTLTVSNDEEVSLRTFGKFVPRTRSGSTKKTNPRTGEPMKIPPRRSVVFFPSTTMKQRLNGRRRRKKVT